MLTNQQNTQPTMQMQPPPVQQPYTCKPRGRNAILIINPDPGDEVKVDSGSSEAPQSPTPLVAMNLDLSSADLQVHPDMT